MASIRARLHSHDSRVAPNLNLNLTYWLIVYGSGLSIFGSGYFVRAWLVVHTGRGIDKDIQEYTFEQCSKNVGFGTQLEKCESFSNLFEFGKQSREVMTTSECLDFGPKVEK
jgi:hypothetical protein